jgi:hypothetical protein
MPKKSGKRSRKPPGVIVITLTEEQRNQMRESIRKHGMAKFKIEEIEIKAIPGVRDRFHPIQI